MQAESLMRTQDLKKVFPLGNTTWHALRGVSIRVPPQSTVGCIGESGSGKTTLARVMVRLEEPTSGRVLFGDQDLASFHGQALKAYRRQVQMVFQDPYSALPPRMKVSRILEEPLLIHGIGSGADRAERSREVLDLVGLDKSVLAKYPHQLSGGQRQRINIARALMLNCRLLIADEPVSALDVSIQSQILNLIVSLQDKLGFALFMISHDISVIHFLSDHIVVLYLGTVMEEGPAAAIVKAPAHPYTQSLINAMPGSIGAPPVRDNSFGDTGSATSHVGGCPFAPRCPLRARLDAAKQRRCDDETPALRPQDRQVAACHWI